MKKKEEQARLIIEVRDANTENKVCEIVNRGPKGRRLNERIEE